MAAPSSTPCRAAAVSFDMLHHHWVAEDAALARAAQHWDALIALDTEFQRTDTYYPIPGLYQVATQAGIWLIDPLAINDWTPLQAALCNPACVKVVHSCSEDVELLRHHLGVQPVNLFDTQVAYGFLSSHLTLGYADLVKVLLGLDLPKHETRSDWLRRPLTDRQRQYACQDVASLPALRGLLRRRLEAQGRWLWFQEDMAAREQPLHNNPEAYFLAVQGAWRLQPPQLGALRALCAWRERQAMAEDRPRNRVVRDEHLLAFARLDAPSGRDIRAELPHRAARRYGKALIEAHRLGRQSPESRTLPRPLSRSQNTAVKELRAIGRGKAEALGMAPELLSRRRDIEACVRHHQQTGQLSAIFHGWRGALVGADFIKVLEIAGR